MNLLSNGQTADWQKAILNVLGQTELMEEERETAQAFFDFSKEMDISLLEILLPERELALRPERLPRLPPLRHAESRRGRNSRRERRERRG